MTILILVLLLAQDIFPSLPTRLRRNFFHQSTQHTTHANTTMAKVLTSIVLLSSSAQAFVARPITSRNDINSHSSLKMSEIEVVSQPDKDFLEKKG